MATEDLATYTEVDGSGVLTVTSARVTGANADDDLTWYLYKDFGVDFFNGFDIYFEMLMNSTSATSGRFFVGFTNTVNTWNNWGTTAIGVTFEVNSGTPNEIELWRGYTVAGDTYTNAQDDTIYYCTLSRSSGSDTVTLKIYSDSSRISLVDTLSVSGYGAGTKYRYFYAAASAGEGTGGRDFNGYNQNFTLQQFIPRTGGIF